MTRVAHSRTERENVPPSNPFPGTRPVGSRNEREAGLQVREMFGRIAPRYDFLNHFLSASFDKLWRKRVARRFVSILRNPDARALDLCCGTGDLAFAFAKESRRSRGASTASLIATDFALPMLELAKRKNVERGAGVSFLGADALALPFTDSSFDLVSAAFGFRNLANYRSGLVEIRRVLRPGGKLAILEFCEPESGLLAAFYRFYFTCVLPKIGGVISGSGEAYSYLPRSVEKFPPPEVLRSWMVQAGFKNVEHERWTCGSVALHRAERDG
ncbi:MAG TPA: bifunctional demethylmenaquinone methyltransferase/2-methoxy-6-polyprenyl-1,4-benzoquinol methylase UbiE [Candidatus Acidoferrales bacterium]|nr:bifunctional demethylmenaquinone methyltransferase/2-methoxy-6-polyprenyl-1,4-benzoquinol methylase UbiE [Candidatus Acidoferrales bacterium]